MKKTTAVSVAEAGRRGGHARALKLTPQQRSESARNAVTARWAKNKAKVKPKKGKGAK